MQTTTPVNAEERYKDVAGMSYLAIDQYQRELAWTEPLSYEEQDTLFARVARAKRFPENAHYALLAKDARARLVEQYQPLVLKMARQVVRFYESMEVLDLVNEGSVGLMRAIDRYSDSPNFHGHFHALATLCVRDAFHAARRSDGAISLPPAVRSLLVKLREVSSHLEWECGTTPSPAHLASLLGVSEEKVFEVQYFVSCWPVVSLEALSSEDEQVEECRDVVSLFPSSGDVEGDSQMQVRALFERVFGQVLTPREREVLQVRYGFGGHVCAHTLAETAKELEMTTATVETKYRRATKRLRKVLEPLVSSREGMETVQAQFVDSYSVEEVAACLGVSPSTVTRYIAQGRLPAWHGIGWDGGTARCWRLPKAAIDRMLAPSSEDGVEVSA